MCSAVGIAFLPRSPGAQQGKVGVDVKESGGHVSANLYGNGFPDRDLDWGRVEASVLAIVGEGFQSCDDPDCDVCSVETE